MLCGEENVAAFEGLDGGSGLVVMVLCAMVVHVDNQLNRWCSLWCLLG
jgi:hypothetical protein